MSPAHEQLEAMTARWLEAIKSAEDAWAREAKVRAALAHAEQEGRDARDDERWEQRRAEEAERKLRAMKVAAFMGWTVAALYMAISIARFIAERAA